MLTIMAGKPENNYKKISPPEKTNYLNVVIISMCNQMVTSEIRE